MILAPLLLALPRLGSHGAVDALDKALTSLRPTSSASFWPAARRTPTGVDALSLAPTSSWQTLEADLQQCRAASPAVDVKCFQRKLKAVDVRMHAAVIAGNTAEEMGAVVDDILRDCEVKQPERMLFQSEKAVRVTGGVTMPAVVLTDKTLTVLEPKEGEDPPFVKKVIPYADYASAIASATSKNDRMVGAIEMTIAEVSGIEHTPITISSTQLDSDSRNAKGQLRAITKVLKGTKVAQSSSAVEVNVKKIIVGVVGALTTAASTAAGKDGSKWDDKTNKIVNTQWTEGTGYNELQAVSGKFFGNAASMSYLSNAEAGANDLSWRFPRAPQGSRRAPVSWAAVAPAARAAAAAAGYWSSLAIMQRVTSL